MTIDIVAQYIGYAAMIAGGLTIASLAVTGAAILSNRAQHAVLDSYGGWSTFYEYMTNRAEKRVSDAVDRLHK